jgi:8-oxo-dGTP pyrophosphatase MutT (NUDIX family)
MEITPFPASSVILVRDTPQGGVETFLVKRHGESSFMGGLYAFPGGKVEASDSSDELFDCVEGLSRDAAQDCLGAGEASVIAAAYWIAAIREVFEEVGVLFARDAAGNPLRFEDEEKQQRFERYRGLLFTKEISFNQLLQQEHLTLMVPQLFYYEHWITPVARPIRYDTYFFLAEIPAGQTPSIDYHEINEGLWQRIVVALEENTRGARPLTPPALCMLHGLQSFSSVHAIKEFCRTKRMSDPIVPLLTTIDGRETILLPADALYTAGSGESAMHKSTFPRPQRLVLKEGRWLPA